MALPGDLNWLTNSLYQVTKLCGPEPLTKYVVAGVVALQVLLAHLLRDTSFWSWKFWAVAYVFGATSNQNLFLAIHEISHNLAFRSPLANRLFAIFANLPIAVPYSASFRVCPFTQVPRIDRTSANTVRSSPTTSPTTSPSASTVSTQISPPPSRPSSSIRSSARPSSAPSRSSSTPFVP